ncbi:MAG TPA: 5'-nucleotidase domain-containing protein, partial [Candidatus Krumholzibacteria bacterium]|nr:5'-nucleotidase domain-containing protein [Candidatus Krumholzibacteria bacterium]
RDDVARFVSGAPGLAGRLAAWASAGKTLFIVTNSEPDFATAVLDTALGPGWMELFRVVITAARKPAFFAPGARAWQDAPGTRARVVAGGSARYAETVLGAAGHDVLFVGDNLKSDVRAARAHGWQTVHVVPELDATPAADATGWGDALADAGSPTWLAELIRTHADVACAAVGDLLTLDPRGPIVPPTRRAAGETA